MAIQKQFVLRYREAGHVRFEIPVEFCDAGIAKALTSQLLAKEGIYRVTVYRNQRKLSIRYQDSFIAFNELCLLLSQLVADLENDALQKSANKGGQSAPRRIKDRFKQSRVTQWFNRKFGDAKETVQAAKILTKSLAKPNRLIKDPEKFLIDFLNDILVLFLISLHWEHITKQWIPRPIKYRYEWMAVFYMIYLLMRSRRPK